MNGATYAQESFVKLDFDSLFNSIPKVGERFTHVLKNESLNIFLYAPRGQDLQQPHGRDEFYIVQQGTGIFRMEEKAVNFKSGDLLFAPAKAEHNFESFSPDLIVWVIFFGDNKAEPGIIQTYLSGINTHNVESMMTLLSEDHVMIDSQGKEVRGKKQLESAWRNYFQLFPDYSINVQKIMTFGDERIIVATASAGSNSQHWELPVIIKAKVQDDKIMEWQVFADTKIPFDKLQRR